MVSDFPLNLDFFLHISLPFACMRWYRVHLTVTDAGLNDLLRACAQRHPSLPTDPTHHPPARLTCPSLLRLLTH